MSDAEKTPQQLMASCQGLVRSLAWTIHRKLPAHVELDDLIGYGQVGLAEAARDFDPKRGGQFTTFAYYRIRGAILDGLSKMNWFNRSDFYRGRYERLANEVLNSEQAAESGSRIEEDVRWFKGVTSALAVVYLCAHRADDETAEANLADPAAISPVSVAIRRETYRKLHDLIDALPGDSGRLIRSTYFEGLTLKEAGERLGISKAWASRLHAKALGQLARSLRLAQVAD
jgi:RNA polymerase sigma factor for flagellar operon FliA